MTVDRTDTHWLIRLEGDYGMASAAELQGLLLTWLSSGQELRLDLERAGELHIAVLQLLWAAGRAAEREHRAWTSTVGERVKAAFGDAGFPGLPGESGKAELLEG